MEDEGPRNRKRLTRTFLASKSRECRIDEKARVDNGESGGRREGADIEGDEIGLVCALWWADS